MFFSVAGADLGQVSPQAAPGVPEPRWVTLQGLRCIKLLLLFPADLYCSCIPSPRRVPASAGDGDGGEPRGAEAGGEAAPLFALSGMS